VGCVTKSLGKRISKLSLSSAAQTQQFNRVNQTSSPSYLSWKEASGLLLTRNLNLQLARTRLAATKKQRDEQWKTWLPRVGVYANLQSSLSQLANLAFSDFSAAVVAPLNIPNPLTEQATAYENALTYLESKDSLELTERRQITALYRIFSRFDEFQTPEKAPATASTRPSSVSDALTALETQTSRAEVIKSYQAELAQLLNLPGTQPTPIASTRPKLNYETRIHQLVPGKNYGQLAVRLSAYQIEGALLREKGIKLRRWPAFSVSASNPSVYDSRSSGSSGAYFDTEKIALFGGLTKSYDFTGAEADGIRSAEENTDFIKQNLRLRLDQESREWLRLRAQYEQILLRKRLANDRLARIQRGQQGGSATSQLLALREARRALASVAQTQEQLDLELWVWDDDKWN
jgi:hypothetical protein